MKSILVALDNSARAPGTLRAASEFAEKLGAKLTLLRAIPWPTDLPLHPSMLTPGELESELLRSSEAELLALTKNVPKELIGSSLIRFGTPWKEICEAAKEINADLIVIGAHGYSFVERVLGTTAARVSNHAHCTVLLVREPALIAAQ